MDKILESLTPVERQVLPYLKQEITLEELKKDSKLSEAEVSRAIRLLENKKLISTIKKTYNTYSLGVNGKNYLENSLPELRFLKAIEKIPLNIDLFETHTKLTKEEVNICTGILKRLNAIKIDKKLVEISFNGKNILQQGIPEQKLLEKISHKHIPEKDFSQEEVKLIKELQKRREIIQTNEVTEKTLVVTPEALKLSKSNLNINVLESLTPEMLKNKSWQNKRFRSYDLMSEVPRIYPGKRHFVNQSIEKAKRIWLDMGFEEMTGTIVNSSFWNFDALFTPQDHPAREMQDTFFLDGTSNLPKEELVNQVKKSHEKYWNYSWSEKEAKKLVLRTHTTVLSAQTLAKLNLNELPKKYFAISRNYRNEAVDWSHLFEFDQAEGIVVDERVTFTDLLGYLKQFFEKMGYEQVRFRPGHFPYTEPSVEIDVYIKEKKKWIELGGAGIFRPELVIPLLGKDIPVLAWGLGLGRTISNNYDIKDIRDLYKNDLKQLREVKTLI